MYACVRQIFLQLCAMVVCLYGAGAQISGTMASAYAHAFIENRGQVADVDGRPRPDILYSIQGGGASVYFLRDRISYVFARIETNSEKRAEVLSANQGDEHHREDNPCRISELYRMDVELAGSNPHPIVEAAGPLASYSNYYLGHCPDGILNVRSFTRLTYRDIYPNIDMVMRMEQGGIKCDFVVRPGGRVSDIRMRYAGADAVKLGKDGGVKAVTPLGQAEEADPYSYQTIGGAQREVSSGYVLEGDVIGLEVGEYDKTQTLVIDPLRAWATYYGGAVTEGMLGSRTMEFDRDGNLLIIGTTAGLNFPVTTGAFQTTYGSGTTDAFIAKFDPAGEPLWSTFYGGSDDELPHGVANDGDNHCIIAGHTESRDFPVDASALQKGLYGVRDAFVISLDAMGKRVWGTYYGNKDFDDSYGVAVDSSGNVIMALTTERNDIYDSNRDIQVVKLTGWGEYIWDRYYGGRRSEDHGYAVTTDPQQNIIVAGWTIGTGFPVTANAYQSFHGGGVADAVVVKFTADGTLDWATFYGGGGQECEYHSGQDFCSVAADIHGNIVLASLTTGKLPVTPNAMQVEYRGGTMEGFVAKFNAAGIVQWSTYIGGNGEDVVTAIALSSTGDIIISGFSGSTNFPVTPNADQAANAGGYDAFVSRLDSNGMLVWSTYYGGSAEDHAYGVAATRSGSVAVAGVTASNDLSVRRAFQRNIAGGNDAFVAYFCDISDPILTVGGPLTFQQGDSVILSVQHGHEWVLWSDGSNGDSLVVRRSGDFWVRLSNSICGIYSETVHVQVLAPPPPIDQLWSPRPNLRADQNEVLFETAQQGAVQLYIVDDIGRRIATLVDDVVDAGRHQRILDTGGLASGKYFLILQTPANVFVEQLIVEH